MLSLSGFRNRRRTIATTLSLVGTLLGLCREVCSSHLNDCAARLRLTVFFSLSFAGLRNEKRLLHPDSINSPAISGQPGVVAKENSASFKRDICPGVVGEVAPAIGGPRQDDNLFLV